DCLPAAVLELGADQVRQVCVRTCLARNVRLEDYTELTAQALADRARSSDPQAREALLEVYGLFASEYDYRPVDVQALPHGPFAVDFVRTKARRVLHSYGAIQCLERRQEPLARARECARVGRFELAATFYQQALDRQPGNWVLLNEVAMFLTFSLRDPKAGADLAKVALALNPTCSSDLWNTLGDAL